MADEHFNTLPEVASNSSRCVVVFCTMHRSGSSVSTRILHELGLSLGPFPLLGAGIGNRHGHFEALPFVDLNQTIQQLLHGFRDEVPQTDADWESFRRCDPAVPQTVEFSPQSLALGQSLLTQLANSSSKTGFKDPRTAICWPFWREVWSSRPDRLNNIQLQPVILSRAPHAIAMSLFTRSRGRIRYLQALDATAVHLRWLLAIRRDFPAAPLIRFGSETFREDLRNVAIRLGLSWSDTVFAEHYHQTDDHHPAVRVDHVAQDLLDQLESSPQFISDQPVAVLTRSSMTHSPAIEAPSRLQELQQQLAAAQQRELLLHEELLTSEQRRAAAENRNATAWGRWLLQWRQHGR